MSDWSLATLLSGLHDDIQQKLAISRKSFAHPGTKGDASESVWLEMLQAYLPQRYQAASAHVVDSLGQFSDQIDIVVFDRQYSPFIFRYQGQTIVPAESVYGTFEANRRSMPSRSVTRSRKWHPFGVCTARVCPSPMPAACIRQKGSSFAWRHCESHDQCTGKRGR